MDRKTAQKLEDWNKNKDNLYRATPIELNEDPIVKKKRIKDTEENFEIWAEYYFPNFYTSKPAQFHIEASKRIIDNSEWFEVRSWSRELAKSTRTMMEVLFLILTKRKKNVILVSSSYDNAERLLAPYKKVLELNDRIICDYGQQESTYGWSDGEFVTKSNVSFRALGKGQSPRGTRNDEVRPDILLLDDFDTDEECRSPERIKQSVDWTFEALFPTRSISIDTLILACGNIISTYCCITELAKKADKHDIVNIDTDGISNWKERNSAARIARVQSQMTWAAIQKEHYNNPTTAGDVFEEIYYKELPKLSQCDAVLAYSDPATSNKDKGTGSTKGVAVIGKKGFNYFIYKVWLGQMSNSKFVDCLFEAHKFIKFNKVDIHKVYIENNSLQNPFYEQVIYPMIRRKAKEVNFMIPITPDERSKPEKYTRIEGTLEPKNRLGNLIFNIDEENNPHMKLMHSQFIGVSIKAKVMDGPDAIEGGVWILENNAEAFLNEFRSRAIPNRKY